MSDGELLDAREAMSLLGINEAELQTMVARGDLRAFRSAGTMKFRRDDVVGIKSEKKTDPTIIMPQPGAKKPGSGILPTVASARSPRGSSNRLPTVKPAPGKPAATIPTKASATPPAPPPPAADTGTSSDQIILEEFELAPSPDETGANTQNITAQQTAVSGNVTAIDIGSETGGVTVVEPGVDDLDANATASAIAPVAVTATTSPSGRQKVPSGRSSESASAPAMSRVRAAVSSSSQNAAAKRAQSSATSRSAGPLVTLMLIVTSFFSMLALTVIGVQMFKGNYDTDSGQRVVPPFLEKMPLISYESTYHNLPGHPSDTEGERKRPTDEFPTSKP